MKKILCLLFLVSSSISSIDIPHEPTPPNLDSIEKLPENSKKENKKNKNLKTAAVTVKLCDSRRVSGTIQYEKEEISFQHTLEGIKYEKKLQINEIKHIKILSWELKKGKKVKEGTTYQTSPLIVQISTKTDENFFVKGLQDTEFLNLVVSNQNGIAKLYTYWFDLLYENGSWFSKLGSISGMEREDCHSDVIRVIQFN